jgi:hypothetical protein
MHKPPCGNGDPQKQIEPCETKHFIMHEQSEPQMRPTKPDPHEPSLSRFHVTALATDRDLIRALAKRLAEGGPDGSRLRAAITQAMTGAPNQKGGILAALRRSPLVGADLDLSRHQ